MTQLIEQFGARFAAGSPGFYVNTPEEARLDTLLAYIAQANGLHILEWNLGLGPVRFDTKQPLDSATVRPELAAFLEWLRLDSQYESQLIVIKNARLALENDRHAIAKLRQLLNLIERHHAGKAAVLLVAESWQPPLELEALLTQLKLPLPRLEEILEQLDQQSCYLGLEIPAQLRGQAAALLCGLDLKEIERVLKLVRHSRTMLDEQALRLMLQAKEQRIAQSGLLEMIPTSESLADIGGLQNLKAWLARKSQILKRLPEAQQAKIQLPKGCLIAGIPGCGKSLSAKVAAHEFGQPLLRLDIGAMLGKYVGESEHNMRRALALAEAVSPCVLWVDELEKAFVGLNSGASEVSARLLGNFLTWMQERTSPVFVIATANDVTITPPELLRKGRFDEIFYAGFPNVKERQEILSIHLRKLGQDDKSFDLSTLAKRCRDFTGADIQNALNDALEAAFLDNNRPLNQTDLETAIKQTVPLRVTLRDKIGEYEELFDRLKLTPASEEDEMSIARMSKWATDENPIRRKAVAEHADCPDDLLEKLAEDQELLVRKAVLNNPCCPESVQAKRLAIKQQTAEYDHALFEIACMHQNAPLDLLHHLKTQGRLNKKAREIFEARAEISNFHPGNAADTHAEIIIDVPEKMQAGDLIKIVRQVEAKMTPDMFRQLGELSHEYDPTWYAVSTVWKRNDGSIRDCNQDWNLSELIPGYDESLGNNSTYLKGEKYLTKKFDIIKNISKQFQWSYPKPLPSNSDAAADISQECFYLFSNVDNHIRPSDLSWLGKYSFCEQIRSFSKENHGILIHRRDDTDANSRQYTAPFRADTQVCRDILKFITPSIIEGILCVMQKDPYAYLEKGREVE